MLQLLLFIQLHLQSDPVWACPALHRSDTPQETNWRKLDAATGTAHFLSPDVSIHNKRTLYACR